MKFFFKIFLKFSLLLCFMIVSTKSWQMLTHGFRKEKIKVKLQKSSKILDSEKNKKVLKILSQNFYYLDKGCQTYVFESENKEYVLKFIRFSRYKMPFWMNFTKICEKGKDYYNQRQSQRQKRFFSTMRSYEITDEFLKKETGVIYVHLKKTNLNKIVKFFDKTKRSFDINVNDFGYILQRKAQPFEKYLKKISKSNKDIEIVFNSFVDLTLEMFEKKIVNKDYNSVRNTGVLDNKIICTDVGSFYENNHLDKYWVFHDEFTSFTKMIRKWFIKNSPEKLHIIDKKINEILEMRK